jgi:hypothetical protein
MGTGAWWERVNDMKDEQRARDRGRGPGRVQLYRSDGTPMGLEEQDFYENWRDYKRPYERQEDERRRKERWG